MKASSWPAKQQFGDWFSTETLIAVKKKKEQRIKEGRCPSLDCPLVKASHGKIFQAVSQPFPASDFDHMGKSSYMPAKLRKA